MTASYPAPPAPSPSPAPAFTSIALVPGEQVLFVSEFTPHPILTHLKTKLVITDRRIISRRPTTWFVFFRRGFYQTSCPLEHVNLFSYGVRQHGRRLVYGILACLSIIGLPYGIYLLMTLKSIELAFQSSGSGWVVAEAASDELPAVEAAARLADAIFYAREQPTAVPAVPAPPPLP